MPTEKRARHKAARQAKMAELRRAQQRRRNLKRGGVAGIAVLIALVLALVSSGTFSSGKKKETQTKTPAATTTTTVAPSTTTTVAGSKNPKSLSALAADLVARTPPAKSASCTNPSTGTPGAASTSTTTVPAKGHAVAIIPAPKGVGFPNLNGSAPHYTKFTSAPPFCINVKDTYTATMKTTAGTIVISLLPKYAPQTVDNFVFLAGYHFYDGIVFHRVIPGFVDQAGDPLGTGSGGPGYTIADENPKTVGAYDAGSLAMANTGQPHSGGSQFFIVDGAGGASLGSPTYAVFGQVTAGLSAADKINAGGGTAADSGVPPKILYKILSVTISVTGPGSSTTATSTATTSAGTASTTTPTS